MNKKIIITGGGTGGHVFPALSIAEELRKRGWTVLYVGTAKGMESKLVPEKGFPFVTLKTGAVKNQSAFKIVKTLFQLVGAIFWSLRFLLSEKPSAVLGVGGYVSFPISIAAFILRIPLYLQEQNSSVGIANRILGRISKTIFLGFEQAKRDFPEGKCVVTGNPLRASFYQIDRKNYAPNKNFLFVMGGSQGARAINEAMKHLVPKLLEKIPTLKVLHQTGVSDLEKVKSAYAKLGSPNLEARAFITDMVAEYGKASLVISRSGALSVSELVHLGMPAIFVPFPRKGQNDQTTNAYLIEELGGGRVVEQGSNFEERLWSALSDCLNPTTLQAMSNAYEKLPRRQASAAICDYLDQDVQ